MLRIDCRTEDCAWCVAERITYMFGDGVRATVTGHWVLVKSPGPWKDAITWFAKGVHMTYDHLETV